MGLAASVDWCGDTSVAFGLAAAGQRRRAAQVLLRLEAELCADASPAMRAAAYNNAGLAHAMCGDHEQADVAFARAVSRWSQAACDVREAYVPIAGRSSSFHLILAARHHAAFSESRRQRVLEFIDTAIHIAQLNSCSVWRECGGDASPLLAKVCNTFGPDCAEALIIRRQISDVRRDGVADLSPYGRKSDSLVDLAPLARLRTDTDCCADVERAVYLAGLIVPGLLNLDQEQCAIDAMRRPMIEQ